MIKKISAATILTLIFFLSELSSSPVQYESYTPPVIREINLGRDGRHGKFITGFELEQWGNSRNLALIPDCSFRGMNDFEAEVIPPSGMYLKFTPIYEKRFYLYLDLVSYMPKSQFDPDAVDSYCEASKEEQISFPQWKDFDTMSVHWIEISINGRPVKKLYVGGSVFIKTPVVIPVDREMIKNGELNVLLRPSPGSLYFAMWDAFVAQDDF